MASETERIENEIAQARNELAQTLDQLAERANPQRVADDLKSKALAFVNQPAVKFSLLGAGAVTVVLVIRKIVK